MAIQRAELRTIQTANPELARIQTSVQMALEEIKKLDQMTEACAEDEISPDESDGTQTYLNLRYEPKKNVNMLCGYEVEAYRNGGALRYVASPTDVKEFTFNKLAKRIEFIASTSAGDWYLARYRY